MFTFKDSKAREWDVTLNLGAAKRIDNSDFSQLLPPGTDQPSFLNMDKELLLSIFEKRSLLFAMIWAVVQPQVPSRMGSWFSSHPLPWPESPPDRAGAVTQLLETWPLNTPRKIQEAAELEFVESINSKALVDGRQAFLSACGDFFPELRTALSTLNNQWSRLQKQAEQELLTLEPELQARLDRELKRETTKLRKELASDGEQAGVN